MQPQKDTKNCPQTLCAAVIQLNSQDHVQQNIQRVSHWVFEAASRGAELSVIPENFAYMGSLEALSSVAEDHHGSGPILSAMKSLAQKNNCWLICGGLPIKASDESRVFNASVAIDNQGRIVSIYRKLHLFDVAIDQAIAFNESQHYLYGTEVVSTPFRSTPIGLTICYDLRFPELYRTLTIHHHAKVITVPAAFTAHTGKDHWIALLRARAIENQVFVLAAAQWGTHGPKRTTFGRSCIVDPWGTVIAQVSDGEGIALAHLDFNYLATVRKQMPCLAHRRPDYYAVDGEDTDAANA